MDIGIVDYRRKLRRYYVLKPDSISSGCLLMGMSFDKERDEIVGNPSLVTWREVERINFVDEVTKRSK